MKTKTDDRMALANAFSRRISEKYWQRESREPVRQQEALTSGHRVDPNGSSSADRLLVDRAA